MKKVLVGVDGSPESRRAADLAAEIARAFGSQLTLACVVSDPVVGGFESPELPRWQIVERADARVLLRELSSCYLGEGERVDTVMPSGRPAETLADMAASQDMSRVVVGHRGRSGLARTLLGSVADRLTQISPKPILVAR